nr:unnamed protein product [Callosobruchus chinensis]
MTFILVSMRIDKGEVYLVNSSLTWASHVDYLCAKLSSQIFALRQLKSCVDNSTLRTVYYSLIHNCFLCIMTYTVKECLRIAYVLGVHPMMNSKCQLMLHVTITIGAWLSMYLALSLLIYKEEKLTISDFTETFSGMSMLIHGAQRTASLYFNKSKIRQLLEISAKSFWSPNRIKLSPEVLEYTKRYHYRLKLAYRLFVVSCIFNTSGFCYQTFFFEEDILVIQCWKPEWMPFYPFWLFQVLVMYFGVMLPIICLDTLIMTILADNLRNSAYNSKWYAYKREATSHIQLVICQGQKEVIITAGHLLDINLSTSLSMLFEVYIFNDQSVSSVAVNGLKGLNMPYYTIEKCLKMAWIVGAHPDMRHNKWQLSIFVILAIGNWLTIYLIVSLLFYKEDHITIGDFAETFSGMSLVIHAEKTFNSAYFSKWYENLNNAQPTKNIILQSQQKVFITAGRLIDINLATSLADLTEYLSGLVMPYYTIEKCLMMAWIVGAHPDMRNNKWQLSIFVILAIGNWLTIYLIVSLLFYKEDRITIGDFAETFSGMSLVIHGIQRSFSLFFNRKQISEMLQYVRSKFWKESDLDITDEEKYICKKYYTRLKIAMYVFASSCTSNLFGFCCQTFFSDQDILPLDCYKPDWLPFYPFWFLQVLVIFFGVNMAVICLDTLIMTLIVLTHIQFRLLNHEVENLYSYGFQNGNRKYFLNKLRKIVRHHKFLLDDLHRDVQLINRAEKTFNSAYFSKWYENLNNAQPTKNIILQSQQKTVKTMVSYCMFLRTMGVEQ